MAGYGANPFGAYQNSYDMFGGAGRVQAESDREMQSMLQIARVEEQIRAKQMEQQEMQQAQAAALAQQGQAEELRMQVPEQYQQLFDVDQERALDLAFPEQQDPTTMMQNMQAAGFQPGTPEYHQAMRQKLNPGPAPGSQYKVVGSDIFDVSGDEPRLAARGRRNDEPLEQVYDPKTGTTSLVPRSKAAGGMVPPKQGITIGPDGTVQIGGSSSSLGKKARGEVEENLIGTREGIARLGAMGSEFNPEYSTHQGAAKAFAFRNLDRAGAPLNAERKEYLKGYTKWQQNSADNLARYIKEMSGTAASEAEQIRLEKGLPNTKDSPVEYQSKLENKTAQLKAMHARYSYLRNNGIPTSGDFGGIGLDQVPQLIQQRGEQLEQEAAASGMPADQIEMMVAEQLKAEFGL